MGKVVIKILQGSVVTQTVLGRLSIHPRVANFLQCTYAKNYENWLAVDKVIAKISRLTFWPNLYVSRLRSYDLTALYKSIIIIIITSQYASMLVLIRSRDQIGKVSVGRLAD